MTPLELLAPAKNLECGIAAIDHGADAVYIGAGKFGARAAATNSTGDIRSLCQYAHRFGARVYVTVNTIVYDHELEDARRLVGELCDAGADALLVQDMALVDIVAEEASRRGVALSLHASTQTDNRTAEKVEWLAAMGFRRVVLARELSLDEIADIHHKVPGMQLEAFVHGALCVSYSGQCYASQYCFGRSANRGECAQFCRLSFDLVDANGAAVDKPRHWLSLKDMCRIDRLEQMAEAGVCSFKIEGRLKDLSYVKNVVAAYSQALDKVVAQSRGKYCRASLGRVQYTFTPDLRKTFNRGFTRYFIDGADDGIASPDTPKALGEFVGKVKETRRDSFNVAGLATFANGDGLCFFDRDRQLRGFRVNRVEGNRIFPQQMPPQLRPGMGLYRNADAAMDKLLGKSSATRSIAVLLHLSQTGKGLRLTSQVPQGDIEVSAEMEMTPEVARQSQAENIRRQLSRLGNTVYVAEEVTMDADVANLFVPSSMLAELRRQMVAALDLKIVQHFRTHENPEVLEPQPVRSPSFPIDDAYRQYPYLLNVANSSAREFYARQGLERVGEAFECSPHDARQPHLLMRCRHCLRRTMGYCTRESRQRPGWHEPLYLVLPDKRRFRLKFDCRHCEMLVFSS